MSARRASVPARPIGAVLLMAVIGLLAARPAAAEIAIGEEKKLKFFGDIRFRAEADWDSTQSDGTDRADRDRLRIRFRVGLNYAFDEHYSFGARIRTGFSQDQQSPHATLGDEFETKAVNLDKAFILANWKYGWLWAGKNAFPFWVQNELFWDEDVTPEGAAGGFPIKLGESRFRLKPTLGYFIIEQSVQSDRFSNKADLGAVQLALEGNLTSTDLTFAAGYYVFGDDTATVDVALADLDYRIYVGGAKVVFKSGPKPWTIGVDYMENVESYPDTQFNADETTGYVFNFGYGGLKEKHDWLVGYYYAHIEKYAVVARFAQDDWLRWGSVTDTRSSNFEGHELRLAYAFRPSFNVMLRVYVVDQIALETPTAVELEDNHRARLDFNMSF